MTAPTLDAGLWNFGSWWFAKDRRYEHGGPIDDTVVLAVIPEGDGVRVWYAQRRAAWQSMAPQ